MRRALEFFPHRALRARAASLGAVPRAGGVRVGGVERRVRRRRSGVDELAAQRLHLVLQLLHLLLKRAFAIVSLLQLVAQLRRVRCVPFQLRQRRRPRRLYRRARSVVDFDAPLTAAARAASMLSVTLCGRPRLGAYRRVRVGVMRRRRRRRGRLLRRLRLERGRARADGLAPRAGGAGALQRQRGGRRQHRRLRRDGDCGARIGRALENLDGCGELMVQYTSVT